MKNVSEALYHGFRKNKKQNVSCWLKLIKKRNLVEINVYDYLDL